MDEQTVSGVTVHILSLGGALCGLPGVPGDWPKGHVWVSYLDTIGATCKPCVEKWQAALASSDCSHREISIDRATGDETCADCGAVNGKLPAAEEKIK